LKLEKLLDPGLPLPVHLRRLDGHEASLVPAAMIANDEFLICHSGKRNRLRMYGRNAKTVKAIKFNALAAIKATDEKLRDRFRNWQ